MLPVVDIIEVGAGGGSIAWIDEVGALKVGPRSAGGHPGPICYGQGGTEPTVTDANVVLGRRQPAAVPRRRDAARRRRPRARAIRRNIAEPLGMSIERRRARRSSRSRSPRCRWRCAAVSVERGYDPRDFAMVGIRRRGPAARGADRARAAHPDASIVPRVPGHFSALGMLMADLRHDYVRTYYKRARRASDSARSGAIFDEMVDDGRSAAGRRRHRPTTRCASQLFPRHPLRRPGVPDPDAGRAAK